MIALPVLPGATDQSVYVRILDAADGTPETGVMAATAGLKLWWKLGPAGPQILISVVDLDGTPDPDHEAPHADGGIAHVADGVYRVDLPDAAVPVSEHEFVVVGGTADDMVVIGGAMVGAPARLTASQVGTQAAAALSDVGLDTPGATIWAHGTRTLTSFGTLVADVWAGLTATVLARFATVDTGETTAVAGSVAQIAQGAAGDFLERLTSGYDDGTAGGALDMLNRLGVTIYAAGSAPDGNPDWSIRRGDRVVLTISCSLAAPNADREKLWLTVKRDRSQADSAALLMVVEGDGSGGTGLVTLSGESLPSGVASTDVLITAVDEGASTVEITLLPTATALLTPRAKLEWDVQQLRPNDNVQTLEAGSEGAVISDVTRATS